MPITIGSEIYNVTEHYHPNTQCRIISEVIVISIVNPIPLLLHGHFFAILSSQKVFALVSITFLLLKYRQAPLTLISLSIKFLFIKSYYYIGVEFLVHQQILQYVLLN